MGPPMPLSMPQYSTNINNPNQADVHQMSTHYDLVQQSQHSGYATGFHHNPTSGIMSAQNYSGSVHFQPTVDYGTKLPNDDYKYSSDQLLKMPATPPPSMPPSSLAPSVVATSAPPTSALPTTIKSYADHMNESNWNQMYGHHQVYGPPNEYSQMQQNYVNPNAKYWS